LNNEFLEHGGDVVGEKTAKYAESDRDYADEAIKVLFTSIGGQVLIDNKDDAANQCGFPSQDICCLAAIWEGKLPESNNSHRS
jgi:hypothetical protein